MYKHGKYTGNQRVFADKNFLFDVGKKVYAKDEEIWRKGVIQEVRPSPSGHFFDVKLDNGKVGTFHRNYVKLAE